MTPSVYKKALKLLENMAKDAFKDSDVKIVVFGSRARGDYTKTSDIDIGILPRGNINKKAHTLLKEKIESSNIPYKVDIVDLSQTSEEFKEKALKEGIVWKSWDGE